MRLALIELCPGLITKPNACFHPDLDSGLKLYHSTTHLRGEPVIRPLHQQRAVCDDGQQKAGDETEERPVRGEVGVVRGREAVRSVREQSERERW